MIMSEELLDKEAKRQSRTSLAGWIDPERYVVKLQFSPMRFDDGLLLKLD